ncbi:hypothetical protein SAMN05216389_11127 [Oceanobacillus limi]|uniref:Uncharacterized protein n=1 Tax=Oceanobacillus limi TaxID=930131 RepID=A0A1I0EBX3_9BACI|nr:hypothetical protein [Oceanobacillus limi]SET42564.1 hypothetical protein SAMN05216389_11127 [Oceanobacillus limi]
MSSFIEQLTKMYDDQKREYAEIERKERELDERKSELRADKVDVLRGIMKTEQILECYGVNPNVER